MSKIYSYLLSNNSDNFLVFSVTSNDIGQAIREVCANDFFPNDLIKYCSVVSAPGKELSEERLLNILTPSLGFEVYHYTLHSVNDSSVDFLVNNQYVINVKRDEYDKCFVPTMYHYLKIRVTPFDLSWDVRHALGSNIDSNTIQFFDHFLVSLQSQNPQFFDLEQDISRLDKNILSHLFVSVH